MQDFRNLSVWQRVRRLIKSVYEMTADFPGSEEFGLKSQMRRVHGRRSSPESRELTAERRRAEC
jgi:hypothetical protein